jgi:hypothetical protein
LNHELAHPTDRHPPIYERIQRLGADSAALKRSIAIADDGGAAAAVLDDLEALEEELSRREHQRLIDLGVAVPSDDDEI